LAKKLGRYPLHAATLEEWQVVRHKGKGAYNSKVASELFQPIQLPGIGPNMTSISSPYFLLNVTIIFSLNNWVMLMNWPHLNRLDQEEIPPALRPRAKD
jgi:hypothetical protein